MPKCTPRYTVKRHTEGDHRHIWYILDTAHRNRVVESFMTNSTAKAYALRLNQLAPRHLPGIQT